MNTLLILFVYFIGFTDKQGSDQIALSDRALQQREKWGIAIDSLDYAVSPIYLDSIQKMGAKVVHTSRWMNGATVSFNEGKGIKERLEACSFVDYVELTRDDTDPYYAPTRTKSLDKRRNAVAAPQANSYGNAQKQLELYNLLPLHEQGFKGQGIHMAIIDGSFLNTDKLTAFDSVRSRMLGAYDFTDDEATIYRDEDGEHGTQCLSAIAGYTSKYQGAATQASYYIMRSEELVTESPKELDNLVVAFEKADSLGVNIVSTSLGYAEFDNSDFDLTYSNLNGTDTRVSRAATIAARKGMLVCVAQGNEGNETWHYLGAPADADSILAVGAVDRYSEITDFSSYGPAADLRVKPDVCAMGQSVSLIMSTGSVGTSSGTSFACPLIAGMAACLWSALPNENAMQIRDRIIRSTDRYSTPDDQYGYGIPDAEVAYNFTPTAIESIATEQTAPQVQKIWKDGQLYIIRNGHTYNLQGIEVVDK